MTEVTVKRLSAGETETAGALFSMMAAVFEEESEDLSPGYVERLLGRDDFWAMAAFMGGELVGGLTAHTLPLTRLEVSEVFIFDLAVRPVAQRKGVGRHLVEALRHAAGAAGIQVVFVPADNEDLHALDFYRALGGEAAPVTIFTFTGR
ncbi:GNAT family N-acetyltransferase [Pelagibius litoralis]|uniref:GNAT family N-acetyltransferase n=1 Tax=Pelagibius litoralis TaxID=374515 RepID=A0A967EZ21_9PROT|nr:GNAT family N-acetyltransferase [Pelagibius litoralis]NIA70041.1 GNAT family N-acetyltransferase [Pelagibius litoralis]